MADAKSISTGYGGWNAAAFGASSRSPARSRRIEMPIRRAKSQMVKFPMELLTLAEILRCYIKPFDMNAWLAER
jgi:hypothetical protein